MKYYNNLCFCLMVLLSIVFLSASDCKPSMSIDGAVPPGSGPTTNNDLPPDGLLDAKATKKAIEEALKKSGIEVENGVLGAIKKSDGKGFATMFTEAELKPHFALTDKHRVSAFRALLKKGVKFDTRPFIYQEYIENIKNPQSAPSWTFTIDKTVENYVNKNTNAYSIGDWTDVKKRFTTKNKVVIWNQYPDSVFKIVDNKNREKALTAVKQYITTQSTKYLVAPDFKTGKVSGGQYDKSDYIFEQKLPLNGGQNFQQALNAYLFKAAESDSELKKALQQALVEFASFSCTTGFNDIKYDNNPWSSIGKIALIDPDPNEGGDTGDIPDNLFNKEDRFLIPDSYQPGVIEAMNNSGKDYCQESKIATKEEHTDMVKGRLKMYEDLAACHQKNGVVDYSEPFELADEDINKLFSDPVQRKIAQAIRDAINEVFLAISQANGELDVSSRLMTGNNFQEVLKIHFDKITELSSKAFFYQDQDAKPVFEQLFKEQHLCAVDMANGEEYKFSSEAFILDSAKRGFYF